MKEIYILHHVYEYGEDNEYVEEKLLGAYSSMDKASQAIERYIQLEGFRDYPRDCFCIDKYSIDKDSWIGGFITQEIIIKEFEEFTECFNRWIGINISPKKSWQDNEYYQVLCQIDNKRYQTNSVTELAEFIQQIWEQGRLESRDYKHFKINDDSESTDQIQQIWDKRFDYGKKEKEDYILIAKELITLLSTSLSK